MDGNPVDANHGSNVPRFTTLSLKNAIGLINRETQLTVPGNNLENDAKLKSKIDNLWFFFKQIIDREKYGRQAIRLMEALSYLRGTEIIEYGLVDWEYDSYDDGYRSEEIFNILILLHSYGLIQVEGIQETGHEFLNIHNITLPNYLWMSVIREKNGRNPKLEIRLLQTCFKMVEEGRYPTLIKNDHFSALSPYLLKYPVLVNHFKKFFLQNYWNEQVTADILEKFEEAFSQSDHETMGMYLRHLEIKSENKILLTKFEAVRAIFNGSSDCVDIKVVNIAKFIYDIGTQSQDRESRVMFYEESLKWHTMIQVRFRHVGWRDRDLDLYNLRECIERTVNILIELDRSVEIYNLFRELRTEIIAKGKEQIIWKSFSRFGFGYFLGNMIGLILRIKIPTLKRLTLFEETLVILDFAFKIVLNTQKENAKLSNMKICLCFPIIVKNLIKCLIELGQFDEILNVIQEGDIVWQESIQILLRDKYWRSVPDIISYVDGYRNVHSLIFENIDLKDNVELQKTLLRQSVNTIMPICLTTPLLDYCHSKFSFVSFVGKCLIESNQINQLINFMNNLEKLPDRPENEESESHKIFPAQDSEGMIDFCAMTVRRLTPLNGRVEYLPVLEKTLEITKKLLNEGRSNGMRSRYETLALYIIKICESNLER